MALTQIDHVAALVLIDLQKGIVGVPTVHPAAEIIAGPLDWRALSVVGGCLWYW
jgi:hypothetical protein